MGFWNPGQEWESELTKTRRRLTEATECSGESADPEFAVIPMSMASCVSPASAQEQGRATASILHESFEG